jgi:non-ribosomal peptide synthetase-like protein
MNRLFWEWLRFLLPVPLVWMGAVWWSVLSTGQGDQTAYSFHLSVVPLVSLAVVAGSVGSVIGLKWLLLGRVQPGSHPLWSCWASRWDFVCMAWSIYATEAVSALEGTPFLNPLLRTAGVKLGRGVILGGGFAHDLPDPDMLVIEDGATVDCTFQAHTFEDRVLKMDRVIIGRGATVGRNAVLLYGARVGEQTRVAPHSVVMKQEHLLSGHSYSGFPTQVDHETAEARRGEQVAAGLLNPLGYL